MKRYILILCIITFLLVSEGCNMVTVNSADEVVMGSWIATTANNTEATLNFDVDTNVAFLKIKPQSGKEKLIDGVFAIDSEQLYISTEQLKETFVFGYKIYADRLILEYNGVELTFISENEKEPCSSTAPDN